MSVKQKQVFATINQLTSKIKNDVMSCKIKALSIFISVFSVFIFSSAITLLLMGLTIWNEKSFLSSIISNTSIQYNLLIIFRDLVIPSVIIAIPSIVISIMLFGELAKLHESVSSEKYDTKENLSKIRKRGILFPMCSLLGIYIFGDMVLNFMYISSPVDYYATLGWIVMPLLVIANDIFIFREVVFNYKELKLEHMNKTLKAIDDKYISKMNAIMNKCKKDMIVYDNSEFKNIINSAESRNNIDSLELVLENGKLICKANKENIIKCTNGEKKEAFLSSMKQIESRYCIDLNSNTKLKDAFDNIKKKYDVSAHENFVKEIISKNSVRWYDLKFISKVNSEYSKIVNSRLNILNDIEEYSSRRISYLFDNYKIAKAGVDGEENVNKELDKYSDEFINITNKAINLDNFDCVKDEYVMEVDNVVISRNGVFVIEVKNRGDNKHKTLNDSDKILIEREGRWIIVDRNNNKSLWEWNPSEQNGIHIKNLKDIINSKLGLNNCDDSYIEPISIIVIANDKINIDNKSDEYVIRASKLYDTISKNGNMKLTESQMLNIKKVLDDINDEPNRYPAINVYDEVVKIDSVLSKIGLEASNISSDFSELKCLIEDYAREINDRISKYKEQ